VLSTTLEEEFCIETVYGKPDIFNGEECVHLGQAFTSIPVNVEVRVSMGGLVYNTPVLF